jgi:hypothetical protein
MSEDSASSQELHVACELGGQGGNSLLQQNFSSSLTTVHADDTAGSPVLVYTASPAVDRHEPKGMFWEIYLQFGSPEVSYSVTTLSVSWLQNAEQLP